MKVVLFQKLRWRTSQLMADWCLKLLKNKGFNVFFGCPKIYRYAIINGSALLVGNTHAKTIWFFNRL